MKFFQKTSRSTKSSHPINLYPEGSQHPDLPLSPNLRAPSPRSESRSVNRSASLSERYSSAHSRDRRSIAHDPGYDSSQQPFSPDDITQEQDQLSGGLTRSQTVLRREAARRGENISSEPSPVLVPDWSRLPPPPDQPSLQSEIFYSESEGSMNHYLTQTPGKVSSDSGHSTPALNSWNQRRLQRQNAEAGFREQRQGGQGFYSPPGSLSEQSGYNAAQSPQRMVSESQYGQQAQPHPSQPPAYQIERAIPANANSAVPQTQHSSSTSRTGNYQRLETGALQVTTNLQHSPTDSSVQSTSPEAFRPGLPHSRSYTQQQQQAPAEEPSMSSPNNTSLQAANKSSRTGNRQSMQNGMNLREASNLNSGQQTGGQSGGVPAYSNQIVPPTSQYANPTPQSDVGRKTPQAMQTSDDMTEEDVNQLIKDHKELREKYTKVKKYYFEKEDQVKQLQNSLAHQRLAQSRTSLDDSEYTTRFNRLDGLVAQLAFSIRKSWRSVPSWLTGSVNKDAVSTGKQEMTAAGRAFISCWLVEEVFNKYFHPDLDPTLSAQLKSVQRNIRNFAPQAQTTEEEEYLTSKVVNWRLSTLEGLHEALRSKECASNRAQLMDMLKEHLVSALAVHLHEPTPSDLEGGVHMIIELVVSIAIHLPLESRDVVIEYFLPGLGILHEQMKLEQGIPPLTTSIADDANERTSVRSADSDVPDATENLSIQDDQRSKTRSMLKALKGPSHKGSGDSHKQPLSGGSSSSLNRPDSSQGMRQDQLPRVRMAAGMGVAIRGRSVLVKAPVFATS